MIIILLAAGLGRTGAARAASGLPDGLEIIQMAALSDAGREAGESLESVRYPEGAAGQKLALGPAMENNAVSSVPEAPEPAVPVETGSKAEPALPEAAIPVSSVNVSPTDAAELAAGIQSLPDERQEAMERAALLARSGDYTEAMDVLKDIFVRYPRERQIFYDYLTTLAWIGHYAEAASLSLDFPADDAPAYALAAAAQSLRHSGSLPAAEALYRKGMERFPQSPDFVAGLAMTLAESSRPEEAREILDRAGPSAGGNAAPADVFGYLNVPDSEISLERAGRLRVEAVEDARQGRYKAALSGLKRLYDQFPEDRLIYNDYLTVAAWAGENGLAARLANSIEPEQAPEYVLEAGAGALRRAGRLTEARRWYEKGIDRFPANLDIKLGLALTWGDSRLPAQGLAVLLEADKGAPVEDRNQIEEIRQYLRRLLPAAPASPPSPPFIAPVRPETAYRPEQDGAVALAREGRLGDALAILSRLYVEHPDDQFLLADYLIILSWNRENEQVLALAKNIVPARAPIYALITVAAARASVNDYYGADKYLDTVLRLRQREGELLVETALVESRLGHTGKAYNLLTEAQAARIPGMGHRIDEAKLITGYEKFRSLIDLETANRRLDASPGNRPAEVLQTQALSGVGASNLARSRVNGGADLSADQIHNIMLAAGRKETRWGEQTDLIRDMAGRLGRLQTALDSLDRLAARPDCQETGLCADEASMHKVQGLNAMNRLPEATAVYEQTQRKGLFAPSNVELAAGGSYLGQRQPKKAAEAYQKVVDMHETSRIDVPEEDLYQAEKGLFWAYLEAEYLVQAREQAWRNLANVVSPPTGRPSVDDDDWRKPDAMNAAGLGELYTGHLDNSQAHFQNFLSLAPANSGALSSMSMTYSMRGLPRAAWEEATLGRLYAPADPSLAVRQAQTLLDLNRWREAHQLIQDLEPYAPYVDSVKELLRRWETHNLREARLWVNWAESDSDQDSSGTNISSDTPGLEWRLFSSPLSYNWRAFIGSAWENGEFEEGKARQDIMLGGIEYRGENLEAVLEARNDHIEGAGTRFGLELSGTLTPKDHWRFPFSFQKTSRNTPLRARYSGIHADSAEVGVEYYRNESRSLSASTGYMDFSDGNRRLFYGAGFRQRLWTWYNHFIDGNLNAYASHNSEDAERPYFNPKSDLEFGGGLTYGALLWRNYDKSLSHFISGGAGNYNQKHFGSDVVWDLGYRQELDITDRFSAAYGLGYSRRVYDGDPEKVFNTHLYLMWKF